MRVVGETYIWGADSADGWAIWLRERPSAPALRFGADEHDRAQRLFEELEFFETFSKETVPESSRSGDRPEARSTLHGGKPAKAISLRSRLDAYERHPSHRRPTLLPSPPRDHHRHAPKSAVTVTKVGLTILATAILAALAVLVVEQPLNSGRDSQVVGSGAPAPVSSEPSPTNPEEASTLPGVQVYANQEGGYLFSYPDSWTVDERGTEANLTSPDGSVRVVFGLAPGGSLSRASDVLVERVMHSHSGVQVMTSSRRSTEQGMRTLLVGGTVREDGVGGRFLAILVQGFDENKAITVYFPRGLSVLDTLADIRAVVSSYRVATPS